MNYTLKAIQTVAISVPIILCSETTAQAEETFKTDSQPQSNTAEDLKPQATPTVAEIRAEEQSKSLVAQSLNQSSTNISYAPKNLNPSDNLLELPAKSSEVNIEIDRPIRLQQAVELAIKNNPNLQEFRLNLERSQKVLREAKAARYPSLSTGLNFSEAESVENNIALDVARKEAAEFESSSPEIEIDEDMTTTSFSGDLTLTYNLYTGGLRGARIQQAEELVNSSQLNLKTAIFETRFTAIRDYYSLQSADSQVEIEQAAVNEAQQTLQDAQLLRQAGIGTKFDVLRAEVELANARQRLATITAEQNIARRQLATTLGVGQKVELKTADEVKPAGTWQLSLSDSIVAAYKNRSELQELLVQREINQKEKQIALAAIRPQVDLVASYNVGEDFEDDVNLTDGYSVGAQLNWNLYDGGAASAQAKQSEVDIAINETQFANQRNEIRLEVEQGYFSLAASKGNITTSQKALEAANESLNLARARFQSGVGTQTDVIQAQTELTNVRGNYLEAIINFNQSLNQLERAVANLPDDQLNRLNL